MEVKNLSWIASSFENALFNWRMKYYNMITILYSSPQSYRNGAIWNIILKINDALTAIALSLTVLFFIYGIMKTCGNFAELKRPEQALKYFIKFALTKGLVTYGISIIISIIDIVQSIIFKVSAQGSLLIDKITLPTDIINAINSASFWDKIPLSAVAILCNLFITIISFVILLTIMGRFFKLYLYVAVSPIPLSTYAGEPTQEIARHFLKSFVGVCMEGVIIILSFFIFNAYATTTPTVYDNMDIISMVWSYIGDLILNMLILLGIIRMSDRVVKEMMGL